MKHPDTLTARPNPRARLPLVECLNDPGFRRARAPEPERQYIPCVTNDAEAAAAPVIDWPSEHLAHYPETVVMAPAKPKRTRKPRSTSSAFETMGGAPGFPDAQAAKPKKPPRARKGTKKKPTT